MYYVRSPTQLFDGFKDASGEENSPLVVVREKLPVFVMEQLLPLEIIFVVNKLHLNSCR